ncbi:hypothetical protein JCM16303_001175 [Sporobolomyces ruberrimus]
MIPTLLSSASSRRGVLLCQHHCIQRERRCAERQRKVRNASAKIPRGCGAASASSSFPHHTTSIPATLRAASDCFANPGGTSHQPRKPPKSRKDAAPGHLEARQVLKVSSRQLASEMALPAKPSSATLASASTSNAPPASTSASRSSPVLPSKPLGLPQRPEAPLGSTAGPKSDTDREEGEEEELNPPPPTKRAPARSAVPSNSGPLPPPSRRRGRSPSFDRDDRDRPYPPRGGRYDPYYDDRRGGPPIGRGRMVSRSPPSPARSYRSGRSWSRSRSRSPPPRRGGGGGRGGYRGFARRPFSRSPPPYARRPISRSRSPPPRRYDSRPPLSPDFRRRSRSPPPRGYGRPRGRSISRSPPLPPSHIPFSARVKRSLPPAPEDEDDMIFRKSRRYSRSGSIVSSVSNRMPSRRHSPSPPPRRRSPSPPMRRRSPSPRRRSISPRSRRGSYSPPPRAFRRRSSSPPPFRRSPSPARRSISPPPRRSISPRRRSISPPGRDSSWRRSPPPVPRYPRDSSPPPRLKPTPDGPAASRNRLSPATLDPSIPTGPRNRFGPSVLPTRPAVSSASRLPPPTAPKPGFQKIGPVSTSTSIVPPAGPGNRPLPTGPAASSVPTGPKAWRSFQGPPATTPTSYSASQSPAPQVEPVLASTTTTVKSESPLSVRPPSPAPPPLPTTVAPPPPPPSVPPPVVPVTPATLPAHLIKERELRQAQLELKRRTQILARFLPRSVGGLLVNVQGITPASMQSPGIEIEHEIQKCRIARLTSLEDHVSKLLILRKSDYALQSARAEVEVARERTRLAAGGTGGETGGFESSSGFMSIGAGGGGSGY